MMRDYNFNLDEQLLEQHSKAGEWHESFELLAAPLHEWLYEEQSFEKLSARTPLEQLILSFDYVRMQVGQGGFIQLIQNGYTPLLLTVIESLQALHMAPEMAAVLDDTLKVYVLNQEVLDRESTVEEFGRLYVEFKEFEILEQRFNDLLESTLTQIISYVTGKDFSKA